ncbi:hypothetical protein ACFYWY_14660, partial [Streptomyces sp. NPDC002870]
AAHVGDNAGGVTRLGDSLGNDLGDVGRLGDDLPGGNAVDRTPGGGANHLPGSRADDFGRGPSASHEPPSGGGHDTHPTGGGHGDTTPGGASHSDTPTGGHGDSGGTGHGDGPEHPAGGEGGSGSAPDGLVNSLDDPPLAGGSEVRPDGARYIEEPAVRDVAAARFYDQVRANPDALDIRGISENTGIGADVLDRVRTHFFLTEHVVAEAPGVARQAYFTPRTDIAEIWQAASQRSLSPEEAVKFERYIAHEYVESHFIEAGIPYLRDEPHSWEGYANETEAGYYHVWPESWADAGAHELATSERRGGFGHWGGLGLDVPKVELAPGLSNIDEVVAALFQELRSKGIELK